jgi:hypothetical protein
MGETGGERNSTENCYVRVNARPRGRWMIRTCSYRKRLLHCEMDSSGDVCVQGSGAPDSISKEMCKLWRNLLENVHVKDQESEESWELKKLCSNNLNSQ